ncbi:valine--tRNA ligase [Candidatus Gottesmanbacteria bacterium]|nr:valine--tRNA ligase [Candidatus Gottesmanbacteria bacterium]
MDKTYNAGSVEERIYEAWETSGAFAPSNNPKVKPYTIIMPPPNANDPLHIGHAMFVTVEDILVRFHRMKGDAALWLPGADHAGIETQFVFEKKLAKKGKSRFDFDRKTLYQMIWDYVAENADVAKNQMKKLGASADWNRFTFTLDAAVVDLVIDTFFQLHKRGLLYRDLRLINYCTRCGTGYSELEAKHEVRKDPLLFMKYGPFTIATVRPETKFRDTALAVNPKDKRYKAHIGKTFEIMGLLGPITMTVIADPQVDPQFGTGIMKVTPAHDFHDFELGKLHNLPVTPIIDFNGKMDFSWFLSQKDISRKYRERAERYHGTHVSKARAMMIEDLKHDGLLEKIDENYEHTVATCYRCGNLLEPLPLPQFFLKVKPMTEKTLKALKEKKVVIYGAGHDKILKHWLEELNDWNISRQIVWGIRIPAWYSVRDNPNLRVTFLASDNQLIDGNIGELREKYSLDEITRGLQSLKAPVDAKFVLSKDSPGEGYVQETDTFDTWFSSAQWPFVTLQVNKPNDFARFYPTQVMETAYDILPFWVMRMLMMGIEMTGRVPFETVYFHGLVRDEKGQKMSKSKGNVTNPIDVIDKYGADALRMALIMSTAAGRDSNTGEDKIRGMRNFTNKIWNAARYVLSMPNSTDGEKDQELRNDLQRNIKTMTERLDTLKIGLAAEWIYYWFWHVYCDQYIEKSKKGFFSKKAMLDALKVNLKLLHPFVPFVTEEIWSKLPGKNGGLLIAASWPTPIKSGPTPES